jgi:hypothetical protein
MNNPKNKTSVRQSAFFNPRALIGFGFGAIGLLLGLVAFIALPKQSAWATPSPCTNVVFTELPGDRGTIYVAMESHNEGTATQCTIFYNVATYVPYPPNHYSAVYTGPIPVSHGQIQFFKAFAHALYANPEDTGVTDWYVNNM